MRVWLAVVLTLQWALAALAAGQSDYDDCAQNADQDRRIAGCTRIIDDIGESNFNHALAYGNRGTAWHAKGDNDRAIADYSEAIRLNPKDVPAYNNRGTALRDKGDLDRAIANYNQAIRLDPNDVAAYNNRGNAWHEKGDAKRAVVDYSETTRLDPKNALGFRTRGYTYFEIGDFSSAAEDFLHANNLANDVYAMLWRFIALERLGQDGAAELGANSVWLGTKDWPYPVIDLYLGRRSLDAMRAAAAAPAQLCEANFYGGEWQLLHGNARDARATLLIAARQCSRDSKEYSAAMAELKRLKP